MATAVTPGDSLSSPSSRSRRRISAFSTRRAASSATGRPRPPRLPPLLARLRLASACSGLWPMHHAELRIACAPHLPPSAFIPAQSAMAYPSPCPLAPGARRRWLVCARPLRSRARARGPPSALVAASYHSSALLLAGSVLQLQRLRVVLLDPHPQS